MPEETEKKVTIAERIAVIGLLGFLAVWSLVKLNNVEAASGFMSAIVVYYLSREGV